MPFQPQALDERTLKKFVDRLLQSLRTEPTVSRAMAQEHVAHMLGFQHWHEAITAIGAPRAKPAVAKTPAGEPGLYPAEPLRFSKDHCEALLLWALQFPGLTAVTVSSGEQAMLEVAGKTYRVTQRQWTQEECEHMALAMGARRVLPVGEDQDFSRSFSLTNGERHRVVGTRVGIVVSNVPGIQVTARVHAAVPPSLENLGYTSEQLEILRNAMGREGLLIVSGSTGGGKSTTLAGMTREQAQRARTKHIVFNPHNEFEYHAIPTAPNSSIEAVDLEASNLTIASEIRRSLRRDPTHVLVDQARDMPTMTESIHLAESGCHVNLGIHAESVSHTFSRCLRGFHEQWKPIARQLIGVLSLVLAQRFLPTTDGRRVPIREWLEFTPRVRQSLLEMVDQTATLEHFCVLMESFLQHHGHRFIEDAERLAAAGILSEQTLNRCRRDSAARLRGYGESA
jgi:defect-in-organelle-trafficking protein DotB